MPNMCLTSQRGHNGLLILLRVVEIRPRIRNPQERVLEKADAWNVSVIIIYIRYRSFIWLSGTTFPNCYPDNSIPLWRCWISVSNLAKCITSAKRGYRKWLFRSRIFDWCYGRTHWLAINVKPEPCRVDNMRWYTVCHTEIMTMHYNGHGKRDVQYFVMKVQYRNY